jgi:hypothetical protein
MRRLGKSREVMGAHALGPVGRALTGVVFALIAVSVGVLAVLAATGI